MNTDQTFPFYKKLANILICILSTGFLLIYAKALFCPLFFALLLAILLLPMAVFFEKRLAIHHTIASMLPVLILIVVISLLAYMVSAQFINLIRSWSLFKKQLDLSYIQMQNWIVDHFNISAGSQDNFVHNAESKLVERRGRIAATAVMSATSFLLFVVLLLFDTFFILLYRRLLFTFLVSIFKNRQHDLLYDITDRVQLTIRKYLVGLLIEMAIVSALCTIAFWLIGVKYALFLGLMTGIFNVVPYIGIYSSFVISAFITFATTTIASKVLLLAGAIVAIHLIDANILLPFVVGYWSRINAFATVLGLVAGAIVWGIPGIILSIPANAILRIIFERVDNLKPLGALLGPEHRRGKTRKAGGKETGHGPRFNASQ